MDSFVQNRGRAALTAFAVAWLALGGLALAGPTGKAGLPDQGAVKAAVVQVPHGAYAGTATCLSCHEDKGAATKQGPHSRAFRAGTRCRRRAARRATGTRRRPWGAKAAMARARSTRTPAATRPRSAASRSSRRRRRARCAPAATSGLACDVGRQPARSAQRGLHLVPRRPRPEGRQAAEGRGRDGAVRDLPPDHRQQAAQVQPHAGARGQAVLRVLPQRARRGQREAAEGRRHDHRVVRQLPRREARADALGAHAGHRELRDLPRSARVEQRPDARGQAAVPLPALPRHVPAILQRSTRATC